MKLFHDRRGGSLVEYIVLGAVCMLLIAAAVRKFGGNVNRVAEDESDHVRSLEGWQPNTGDVKIPKIGGEATKGGEAAPTPPPKDEGGKAAPKDAPKGGNAKEIRQAVVDELLARMNAGDIGLDEINGGKLKSGTEFNKDELGVAMSKFYDEVLKREGPKLDAARKKAAEEQKKKDEAEASKKRIEAEIRKVSLGLAKELVSKGGSATQDDVDLVVAELAKLPPIVLQLAKENKVKVVVCRNSITDYATELKGVRPRGWPPGSTWDTVPGVQRDKGGNHEVVVATMDGPGGKRVMSDKHGSCSLVLHEFGHAMDEVVKDETGTKGSLYDDFKAARERDAPKLGDYYKQAGEAGLSEAYAESFAAYYSRKPGFEKDWAGLAKFWEKPLQPIIDARKKKK